MPVPVLGRAALLFPLLAAATAAPPGGPDIRSRVQDRVREFRGRMGVFAKELDTGETIAVDADERFPTASLIKVAVMVEVHHQLADGTLAPTTRVVLEDGDRAGDEPVVLNQLHAGLALTVPDLLALMIAFSDNTATNLLIRLVGTGRVDRRMEAYGLAETKLFRPTFRDGQADVFPELEREFGLGMTTPREIARLFELIARGQVVSPAVSDAMVAVLDRQQDRAMIPRLLPYATDAITVASKSGADAEKLPDAAGRRGHVRTDAAYVRGPHTRFVVAVCARHVADTDWGVDNEALRVGARVSRDVYDHFSRAR